MSTLTGTADNYLDLLARFRTFVTADATLTAAGQNWTELATNATPYAYTEQANINNTNEVEFETYLRAPGLSGTEQIFLQLQAFCNVTQDIYNLRLRGALGYDGGTGFTWFNQPGPSSDMFLYLWNQSIPFWFIANGQRAIVVAKIATNYEMFYIGKVLPDGTPSQYPYPVFIGGSGGNTQFFEAGAYPGYDSNASNRRYSDNTGYHAAFFDPACSVLCHVDSAWYPWCHYQNGSRIGGGTGNSIWPYVCGLSIGSELSSTGLQWLVQNADGTYPLLPVRLEQQTPQANLQGTLDGVFATTGQANSSESTVTIGSDTYLMFQDTFRNGRANFVALKFS